MSSLLLWTLTAIYNVVDHPGCNVPTPAEDEFAAKPARAGPTRQHRYVLASVLVVLSSVLDEHPVATPHVGTPAFRMMNCRTSQMPMPSTIQPRVSMTHLLSGGNGKQRQCQRVSRPSSFAAVFSAVDGGVVTRGAPRTS